jgi:hypothetical protein
MKDISDFGIKPGAFNVRTDVVDKGIVRVDSSGGTEMPAGILPGGNLPLMRRSDTPVGVVPVSPGGMSSDGRAKFAKTAPTSARKIHADVVKRSGTLATNPHGTNRMIR